MWFEVLRIVAELRPRIVLIENVRMLLNRGMDVVLQGLRSVGYDAEWDVIPAAAVGAFHLRERVWIVARPSEHARQHVYGDVKGPTEFAAKMPRAGRMNSSLSELVPVAPRKTKRRDGWSYWTGVNLLGSDAVMLSRQHHTGTKAQIDLAAAVESGLWTTPGAALVPTPAAHDDGKSPEAHMAMKARLPGGPRRAITSLAVLAVLARNGFVQPDGQRLWPSSSSSRDHKDVGDLRCVPENSLLPRVVDRVEREQRLWPTTTTTTDARGARNDTSERSDPDSSHHAGRTLSDAMVIEGDLEVGSRLIATPSATLGSNAGLVTPDKARLGGTLVEELSARLWPTAAAADGARGPGRSEFRLGGANLVTAVSEEEQVLFPTATASPQENRGTRRYPAQEAGARGKHLSGEIGELEVAAGRPTGSLNPDWVEWLMMMPIGWTDLSVPNELLVQAPFGREPLLVTRVASGIKDRTNRLKAIGNSGVWPIAYLVLARALAVTSLVDDDDKIILCRS